MGNYDLIKAGGIFVEIDVLIVEDDDMVRNINKRFLEKIGKFNVVGEASNIKEAKILVSTIKVDLILLDVFLPDGKGIDFLKWIRQNEISLDSILVTADKTKDSVDEAFKYGAIDYLIKPFKFDRFKEALEKYYIRISKFKSIKSIDQESIDEYIFNSVGKADNKSEIKVLDKGLSINTYNKVIEFMASKRGVKLTAEEIAIGSGLARVTARRYLEKMVEENKIELIQEYGRIGRPTNYYKY